MNIWEEIDAIRAELHAADQSVSRLFERLNQVEIRQRAIDQAQKADAPAPPPLPGAKPASLEIPRPPVAELAARIASIEAAPPVIAAQTATAPAAAIPPIPRVKPVAPPKAPRRFGPPEGMSFEEALGTYWFPRIGIPIVAMSVVFFFTYAANQFRDAAWMPYARVGTGLAIAGALLGIGWKLEKKYANYARILMGGGFGVLYFVVFATWYIPQTRIAPSQELTLLALALLVAGWGAIAQWRQSWTVALFMTLMGHFTVALSTLTLENPSRAAVGGLLLLGAGSAWFMYRNGWYLVALAAVAGSYLNQFLWLAYAPPGGGATEFIVGMLVLSAYLLLFAAAERLTPAVHAAGRQRLRNVYAGLNTGGFLLLSLVLIRGFDFARPYDHVLYFATAAFAGLMGGWYAARRDEAFAASGGADRSLGDPLSGIYFTKASALTAVGFAAWLDGPTVTLSLALQALVLLIAARETRRPVGRLLALGTALVAFCHGAYTWAAGDFPVPGDPGYLGYCLVAFATAALFVVLAELYRVTSWHIFPTHPCAGPAVFAPLCRDLEMLPAPEGSGPLPSRMVLAHALMGFGVLLFLGASERLLAVHHAAPLAGIVAAAVIALGLWRGAVPLLTGAAFLSLASVVGWMEHLYSGAAADNYALALGGLLVASLLAGTELLRIWGPSRLEAYARNDDIQGSWQRNLALASGLYAAGAALMTGLSAIDLLAPDTGLLWLGLLALAATLYAAAYGSVSLGLYAMLVALFATIPALNFPGSAGSPSLALAGLVLLGIAATAVEKRYWGDRAGLFLQQSLPAPYLLYGAFAWNALWLVDAQVRGHLQPAALAGLAVLLAAGALWLHARALATVCTAVLLSAVLFWLDAGLGNSLNNALRFSAAALLAAAITGDRYFAWRQPFAKPWPGRLLLLGAWAICLGYNHNASGVEWRYAGLAFIGLGFLGYAALIRGGTAALIAIATAAAATMPVILRPAVVVSADPYSVMYGLLAAYGALIVYWLALERGTAITLARTQYPLDPGQRTLLGLLLSALPALLGVLCLARMEPIHDFYLTLSWTMWALTIFGWALATRQPWFRYMGLAVLGLALGRAFLFDVWKLDALYRAGAMLVLGSALLAVAYGYTRWRAGRPPADPGTNDERDGTP